MLPGTKKNGVLTMRAMIVTTCFFLGTLAVLSGSRGSNTDSSGDLSADLLRGGHTQAVPSDGISLEVYDPSSDYCFKDHETPGKYCWHSNNNLPCEGDGTGDGTDWRAEVWSWWYTDCGPKCTKVRWGSSVWCVSVDSV